MPQGTTLCPGREVPLTQDLGSHTRFRESDSVFWGQGQSIETIVMVTNLINAHLSWWSV